MTTQELLQKAKGAKTAMALASTETKNKALSAMADALERHQAEILAANQLDLDAARGTISSVMLDRLALNYVSGSGLCLGLPELIPGRFITIEGLDGDTVGDYFITKVRHQFGSGGYLTQFEVKGAKD